MRDSAAILSDMFSKSTKMVIELTKDLDKSERENEKLKEESATWKAAAAGWRMFYDEYFYDDERKNKSYALLKKDWVDQ